MPSIDLNWKVAGFAGEGIMTTGLLFSKVCARHGLNIFDYTEYPSLIRGGHNTYQVFASKDEAVVQKKQLNLLVALNKNALNFHKDELNENSLVIYDKEDDNINIEEFSLPGNSFNLPMVRLAEESGAQRVMSNNVAVGASLFFLGLDFNILEDLIKDIFGNKGEEVVNLNKNAARAGYDFAKANGQSLMEIEKQDPGNRYTLTGNEAVGLGAIAGGLQCYIAYPMTPSSSVLHFLAAKAADANIVVKHAEDEISVINMALGASFSGVRVMVGTSGGGFCYMTEALGLSGIAELPIVVFVAMRPGPALGMPTWTAQGDLQFLISASQDEFPRFVLTPSNAQESFELTSAAVNLAEKYQTPVIVATDKFIAESRHTIALEGQTFNNSRFGFSQNPQPDDSGFFPRFSPTENGVSERAIPGISGGNYIANSYEHDQYGLATEVAVVRQAQMEKRFKKFEHMKKEVPQQYFDSQDDAKLTFISYGSSKGVIQEARKMLSRDGVNSNMLHISWAWPFPAEQVKSVLDQSPKTLAVEGNYQGQLARLIAQETGVQVQNHLHKYDGRPFYIDDIVNHVKGMNL